MAGLLKQELWRLLTRVRLPLLVSVMAMTGVAGMWANRAGIAVGPEGTAVMTAPMLLLDNLGNVQFFFCLWPVVFGGTLAEDLATNFSAVILTRAGTRGRWLAAKVLASLALSVAALLIVGAVWAAAAALMAPWDASTAGITVSMADALAARNPLALAFIALSVLGVAGASLAVLSHVVGGLVRSPFASQVITAVLYLVATLIVPGRFNPGSMAAGLSSYAPWATPSWVIGYWFAALALAAGAAYLIVLLKEAR